MIVLAPNPTFEAAVQLTLPGSKDQAEATFIFRTLNRKRTVGMLVLIKAVKRNWFVWVWELLKLCWRAKKWPSAIDMLDEIISDWKGFCDWKGVDVPYSKQALRTLLEESPGAMTSLFLAYMNNQEAARRKN